MHILIVYGTIEGQTGKIARFAEERLAEAGHEVTLYDTAAPAPPPDLGGVDKVILAASVHERRHPRPFEVFVAAKHAEIDAADTLLISVSLSAAFPERREEAGDYVDELTSRTGIAPDHVLLVAGAVRPSSYDYFASQVVQHVALRGHREIRQDAEHEFTDWDALTEGLDAFIDA